MGVAGLWLYRMDAATARGSDLLGPLVQTDPRWSGVYLSTPAIDEHRVNCCFDVHFPALIDGAPMEWVSAKAGWGDQPPTAFDANLVDPSPLDANALQSLLPEPQKPTADFERRVRTLRHVAVHPPEGLPWRDYNLAVLSLNDFGGPEVLRIYLIPATTDPNVILVGGWIVYTLEEGSDVLLGPHWYGSEPFVFPKKDERLPEDTVLSSLLVTSRIFATPTEAHLFAYLMYGRPIIVDTEYGLWVVDQNGMNLLRVW
jgi:hypothetical protein